MLFSQGMGCSDGDDLVNSAKSNANVGTGDPNQRESMEVGN